MRRKCVCLGLAALLLGLLALLTSWECHGWYLVLRNADTGQYYGRYAMDEGDWFSVSFVHSVNKSPVTDCYQIRDRAIYVEKTIYYDFGARRPDPTGGGGNPLLWGGRLHDCLRL